MEPADTGADRPEAIDAVEVRRSKRRTRTVSAYRDGNRMVLLLPARMSRADESHWVEVMTKRLETRDKRRRPSDTALLARAHALSERYLAGRAVPTSVRWVTNQNGRWGSCSTDDRSIRLSHRLKGMPGLVVDYVLLHELVHLLVPAHGPAFWAELESYPLTERAKGFLEGWSSAPGHAQLPSEPSADEDDCARDQGPH